MRSANDPRNDQPLAEDASRSFTLPGRYYHDAGILEREKAAIFHRCWQIVAHEQQLPEPGSFVCAHVADQHVFLMRGHDGAIRGFYNVCQHRAHELLQGRGRVKRAIVCPYHAWSYETDGRFRAGRHTDTLPGFDPDDFGLTPVRVDGALGFLFVNLDDDAPALDAVAGDMFEDMRGDLPWVDELVPEPGVGGWEGSSLAANWKVLAENCLECYHCAPAHPALADLLDMSSYGCEPHGAWLKSFGRVGKTRSRAYAVDPDEPVQSAVFWHLWPNVEFGVLPGEAALGAFRFNPVSVDETTTHAITMVRPGESIRPERLDYRWNVLWPEDESLCRSVHKGLESRGYRQGRFVVSEEHMQVSEHGVHAFQRRYAEFMDLLR